MNNSHGQNKILFLKKITRVERWLSSQEHLCSPRGPGFSCQRLRGALQQSGMPENILRETQLAHGMFLVSERLFG